jgi:hypothetical protein
MGIFSTSPLVVSMLFACGCLLIGVLGMLLGQRWTKSHGKIALLIGVAIGGTAALLAPTPYGYLASGLLAVFLIGFVFSNILIKVCCASGKKPQA